MFKGGAAVGTRQHTEAITQTQHMSDPNGSKHLSVYAETRIALLKMSPSIYDRRRSFGQKPNPHDPNPSTYVSNMAAAVLRYGDIQGAGFNPHLNRHQNVFEEPSDCFRSESESLCSAQATPMLQGPDLAVDIVQFCLNTSKPCKKKKKRGVWHKTDHDGCQSLQLSSGGVCPREMPMSK